jgi:hypothetical protein
VINFSHVINFLFGACETIFDTFLTAVAKNQNIHKIGAVRAQKHAAEK